jgi:hypothetical protein
MYNHLYSSPLYRSIKNEWKEDYVSVVEEFQELTIDITTITSFLSVGQASNDRTIFEEIKRLPWMAEPLENGGYKEFLLPLHGLKSADDKTLAKLLFDKLLNEARLITKDKKNIYILLTGGLDSRIIAGVYSHLYKNGELATKPKCLTWGIKNSRDVYYAEKMAKILEFDWEHIPLDSNTVIENIQGCGKYLGMLHSPEMLHSMLWFKNLPKDSLVIAGSFGDSIGRGEFSNLHLLQLDYKTPKNTYDLLLPDVFKKGAINLYSDLEYIHSRGGGNTSKYMQCEYWMQGYRMRNGLCHALSVINRYAEIYQMFTSPEVVEFMWSLHPSRRDNKIYNELISTFFPKLSFIPWARNNSAIKGDYKNQELTPHYHEYTKWSSGVLYESIVKLVSPEWFGETGLFNVSSIREINKMVLNSQERVGRLNDIWLWLAGFRYYIDELQKEGKIIHFGSYGISNDELDKRNLNFSIKKPLVMLASNSSFVNKTARFIREKKREFDLEKLKKEMLKSHPIEPI